MTKQRGTFETNHVDVSLFATFLGSLSHSRVETVVGTSQNRS